MFSKEFDNEVHDLVREIPAGRVLTYGEVARLIGMPAHARRVGHAMACIPADAGVPCHRVVGSGGRLAAHWPTQRTLLEQEGVVFRPNGCVDMRRSHWEVASTIDAR